MLQTQPVNATASPYERVVNDFCITFSTVNGSGSATANTTIMRALFRMGLPVAGKNIFPSNIQGLPTWYTIRVNKDGFLGRLEEHHIVVAMNPASFTRDFESLVPGGAFFYPDDIKLPITRQDISAYPMPVKKLSREADVAPNLREYIANMVYVGVVAQMIGIDLQKIYHALDYHFKGKTKAIESNFSLVKSAADWARDNLVKTDPYWVEPMKATEGYVMTDGNVAAALGAIYGGVQFVAWYPITPASSLAESLNEYLPVFRKDPETGKNTFVVIQAEDELAAIGMSIGAGWSGLRAMTSTSGPGISLMSEYLGLAYFSEVPVVVWDVQRVGPSTGLPTRTAQADLTQVYFHSHGDTQFVILIPSSVKECFEFGWKAFDIAERYQTPVIILSDLDLGMNQWMSEKFEYPDKPIDRGKILWEQDLEAMLQKREGGWGRYLDIDGDGIPYRTVPGNRHPKSAYFTRGTGHDEYARYSEDPLTWERGLDRLEKKILSSREYNPQPVISRHEGAKIGIVSMGSTDFAVQEARALLAAENILTNYLRVRSIPFADEVKEFLSANQQIYVVEANRDGQLRQLLMLNAPEYAVRLRKIAHVDGLPLTARWIKQEILAEEAK
jgi:2-oxoglutarate ferredoxin oxidoreductase subunit alpha